MRRIYTRCQIWHALFFILFLFSSVTAKATIMAGRDYRLVPAAPIAKGNQPIPVVEFFWYDCPHCYAVEHQLEQWTAKLPKDVKFKHIPNPLGNWKPMANLYYTLKAMGYGEKFHEAIFNATQVQKLVLENPVTLSRWLTAHGINPENYNQVSQSFGVQTWVRQAKQLALQYQIFEVPTFIVDNQYVTNITLAKSQKRLFQILDALITKARSER
ncbi:MAG: thiol:disulfide interchange protein DsbA/DsbL [Pseudomonadota bacterium]|nr:thiol:disulfide interchange protein DsbA/DsbL [Pseudomonadota bacterium]